MPTRRILYVEDNFQNKRLVKKVLKARGYEVLEADNGLDGIAMARQERPDLILMDINMPGMDGMEATAQIKSSPELAKIPIIALTANAMRGDRERIMSVGCDDYLQKPVDNAKLVEVVERHLAKLPISPVENSTPQSSPL